MLESSENFDTNRLRQLIAQKCNGALTADGHEELERLLVESAAARQMYWDCVSIHAGLDWEFVGKAGCNQEVAQLVLDAGDPRQVSSAHSPSNSSRSGARGWRFAVAGCLTFAALFAGLRAWEAADHTRMPADNKSTPASVVLGHLTPLLPNSRWSLGKSGGHNPNSIVTGETVWLDRGAVELRLTNDTAAKLEAPVILQLLSLQRARVLRGRVTLEVAKGAEGFTVETASAEVIDLGTTFSVDVRETGSTDVIVFQGKVDLRVANPPADDVTSPPAVRQLRMGEAIRVADDGTLSRIVHVRQSEYRPERRRVPLISSVRDNLTREATWDFYEIVPGGMHEDAKAFVDRLHEWNGVDGRGLPKYLVGGDYVKTFNSDKITAELALTIRLEQPAIVYVLIDSRAPPPTWVTDSFEDTGDVVGVDEAWPDPVNYAKGPHYVADSGPGNSVDNRHSVWRRIVSKPDEITMGANARLPNAHLITDPASMGLRSGVSMYGIVVTPLDEQGQSQ